MNRRLLVVVSIASASLLAGLVGACGGSDDSTAADGGDATMDDTGTGDVATNDTGSSDTGANDAATSPCKGSDAGCVACCRTLYPDAGALIRNATIDCACTTPGDCASNQLCGGNNNLCGGKNPTTACTACLLSPDAGGCLAKGVSDCTADPSCAPLVVCLAGCGDGG